MKNLKLPFVFLLLNTWINAQDNQSEGSVLPSISNPTQQFGGQEIFRFKAGAVTQLQNGAALDTVASRWFSIGQINTPNQSVYGLRFQLANRALLLGYQDIEDINPRLQWIGNNTSNQGSLEFRFANSFGSTNSNLIATMTRNGQFIMLTSNVADNNGTKLSVTNNSYRTGIEVNTSLVNSNGVREGVGIAATAAFNQSNVSVKGTANGGIGIGGSNIAIQGISNIGFAGFFNGAVTVVGTFTNSSDRKLKTDITASENALENIAQLNGYTYTYKDNDDLNFDEGLQHGLIAQEVEAIYPELVKDITYPIYNKEGDFEGISSYKSVNYIGLISELTEAIKTLNLKVKDLENQLEPKLVYASVFTEEERNKIEQNAYQLSQNTPNPFSNSTTITYALPEDVKDASILVFDLNGKMLKTYSITENKGNVTINSNELNGAGMYLYTLYADGTDIITKRMILR